MTLNGSTHPTGSGHSCALCAAAESNPYAIEFRDGCFTCRVREVSNLPAAARSAFYATLPSDEAREMFTRAVADEYRRRKALIDERPLQ